MLVGYNIMAGPPSLGWPLGLLADAGRLAQGRACPLGEPHAHGGWSARPINSGPEENR
jgi:hypothetical protein